MRPGSATVSRSFLQALSADFAQLRHQLIFVAVPVLLLGCIIDFAYISYPDVEKVLEARAFLFKWPAPEGLRAQLRSDLNWLLFYVGVSHLAKWLMIAVWLIIGMGTLRVVRILIEVLLLRFSASAGTLSSETLSELAEDAERLRWIELRVLYAAFLIGWALTVFGFVEPVESRFAIVGVLIFALLEAWAGWEQMRKARMLRGSSKKVAFRWLVANGWTGFLAPLLGAIVLIYFLVPTFYVLTVGLLKAAIYPLLQALQSEYSQHLLDAVRTHRTIVLPGLVALMIPDFVTLYTPTAGLGELWRAAVPVAVPYLLPGLLVLFVFRVALPIAFSFEKWARFFNLIVLFALGQAVTEGFKWLIENGLAFPTEGNMWLQIIPFLFAITFAFVFEQSLPKERKGHDELDHGDAS